MAKTIHDLTAGTPALTDEVELQRVGGGSSIRGTIVGLLKAGKLYLSDTDPVANGDVVIDTTVNDQLTFKFKGSDGTVRSSVMPLS